MSTWRGHKIRYNEHLDEWLFVDDGQRVKDCPDRPCGYCYLSNTPLGHDGCLGTLPGVVNACCGHGHDDEAYIQFESGEELRGKAAARMFWVIRRSWFELMHIARSPG